MQTIYAKRLGHAMSKALVSLLSCFALLFFQTDAFAQIIVEQDITHVTCAGYSDATATLNISGGVGPYEVVWLNTGGATGMTQTDLAPGSHNVQITDMGEGGLGTVFVVCQINEPEVMNSYFDNETFVDCSNNCIGTASLVIEGGTAPYEFQWPPGAVVSADGLSATGLCAGTAVVTIKDANDCQSFAVLLIEAPENVVFVSTTPTDASCGSNNGVATVEAFNGSPPYTYLWENGETTPSISNLTPGTYTCAVTDNINCTTEASVVVGTASDMVATIITYDAPCFYYDDGIATIDVTNGTPPYVMDYGGADPNALFAGTYTVTITDANNCFITETFTITEPQELQLSVEVSHETCAGCSDGTIVPTAIGGSGGYTFSYTQAGVPVDPNALGPGNYEVSVTDANGCTDYTYIEIESVEEVSSDIETSSYDFSQNLSLYPNPVKDMATLSLPAEFEGQVTQISLIDISGKVLWTNQTSTAKYSFNKGNAIPGVYILEAVTSGARAHIKLIVE